MKKILILSMSWIILAFASFGFSQGLVLKEKTLPEKVVDSTSVRDSSIKHISSSPLVLKEKTNKLSLNSTSPTTSTSVSTVKTPNTYLFPISQVQIFGGYTQYKDHGMRGDGVYFELAVRQKQDESKKSSWGGIVNYGQFTTKNPETDSTEFISKVREMGGGLTFARNSNRPNWNSVVLNFMVKQTIDEGSIVNYRRKQVDISFVSSGYIDLTRNKNIGFSRSNLSWYWQWPMKTEVESYMNGVRVDDQKWNRKMLSINFDQTVLQFDLNDAIYGCSINFGFNLGYLHFSEGKQDMYAAGAFTEFFYKSSKVGRLGFEGNIDPKSSPEPNTRFFTGKKEIIKLDLDFYQIGRIIL